MKKRVFRPREVLVYGTDRYLVHPDRKIYQRTADRLQRVTDPTRIGLVLQQLAYDDYRRAVQRGDWPAGKARPVPPHRPGPTPQRITDLELERAIEETHDTSLPRREG